MFYSPALVVLMLVPATDKTGSLTVQGTAESPEVVMVSLYRVGALGTEPQLVRTRELLNPKAPATTPPKTTSPQLVRIRELLNRAPKAPLGAGAAIGAATGRPLMGAIIGMREPRDRSSVTWKNLPEGTYDISFEAKGYTKAVKRVRVSHDDGDELEIRVELGEPVQKGKKDRVRR